MHRSLAQIILHVALEPDDLDVVAPIFLQVRFGFVVHGTHQPKLCVLQVQPVPRFQQMMDSFPLDERAGKNRPENRRARPRLESLHVHASGQVIKFILRKTLDSESVGGLLGKDKEQVGQIVLFDEAFPGLEQILFPIPRRF